VLNVCEGLRGGGRGLLTTTRGKVVLHYWAKPDGFLLIGEGLWGSRGGSRPAPGAGLTEAGRIVALVALGVAISNADRRERVGEGGGEMSRSSAAVTISSPAAGGRTTSSAADGHLRGGGVGRESQSL